MKEIRWTETAKITLQETSDSILELWNNQVKDDFIDQLEYRIGQLQHNPGLGASLIHKTVSLYYVNKPNFINS